MIAAGSGEEAEGGVVAKAGVDGERWRNAPTIFGVKAEAAERLREGTVVRGSVAASGV